MKKYLPILLLMLSLFSVIDCGTVSAASLNPTAYTSLAKFYSAVPYNSEGSLPEYYSFNNDMDTFDGYIGQFRVFVPPGTVLLDLSIMELGKQMVVARHVIPPVGLPDKSPVGYVPDNDFTLLELFNSDCWVTENFYDTLNIATDGFLPPLEKNKAGWLYAKVGGGEYSSLYNNRFTARVKSDVYNAWWYANIKDEAGWNKYVEGVQTYTDPPEPSTQPILSVSPPNQSVPLSTGTTTFSVSNTGTGTMSWVPVVTEGTDWLTVTSFTSGNSGTVNCSYTAGSSTRTGKIRIVSNGATNSPVEVTVTQTGITTPVLSVTPSNQLVSLSPGTTTFNVSNTGVGSMPWTAAVTDGGGWLTITSGASGTNNGMITCDYTTFGSDRTGKITITAVGAQNSPVVVTVTQSGTVIPVLSVTPLNQPVSLQAGTTTFDVSNSGSGTMPWTAAVTVGGDWLRITSGATGTNQGTIKCSYDAGSSTRTGKIQITAAGAQNSLTIVTVTQAGATMPVLTVTPTNQLVSLSSGTTKFNVSNTGIGSMDWTAAVTSIGGWLTITAGGTGTNDGTITCAYTSASTERTGTIRITADSAPNSPVDVSVTQSGTAIPELTVTPSNRPVPNTAGTTTFDVSNSGSGTMSWTAAVASGGDWLTITSGGSGTNSGTITCAYEAASINRTGTIRITAMGAKNSPFDVTVVQAGKVVPMPIPATGQTKCYDAEGKEITCPTAGLPYYGQDGNFQNNNSMSYTKLDIIGNELADDVKSWAMVRDNVTGLVWEVKTNYDKKMNYWDPHDADNVYTWFSNNSGTPGNGTDTEDFINKLNSEQFGGFNDWRIPTVKELADISTYNIPFDSPVVNPIYFANTVPDIYWSSTPFVINPIQTWGVDFNIGRPNYFTQNSRYYVRAVRGDSAVTSNYEANANNVTITDKTAGLMWQKDGVVSGDLTWEKALEYCEKLNQNVFGGYNTGWRLPSIKELKSLADYTRKDPAINTDYFTTFTEFYWSSTTLNHENYADNAWGVDFMNGSPIADTKDTLCPVRAVRSVAMLSVLPSSQNVTKDAGGVTFNVLITGTQPLPWNAEIVGTSNWLEIAPPKGNNSNTGTITCKYSANNVAESRTATIRITATGAELNNQVDVTVTQDPECAAIKINQQLHIPYLTYNATTSQKLSLSADFIQTVNPLYPSLELYKLSTVIELANPPLTCTPSTLSDKFVIHIPDIIISGTHFWMELTYNQFLSTSTDAIFVATNGGIITN